MAWIVTTLVILPSWALVLCLAVSLLEPRLSPPWNARALPALFVAASVLTLAGVLVWLRAEIACRDRPDPAERDGGLPPWPVAVVSLLAALVVLAALHTWIAAPGARAHLADRRYGAVIDAGSSGSRVAIFEWRVAADGAPHVWPVAALDDNRVTGHRCPLTALLTSEAETCACLRTLVATGRAAAVGSLGEPDLPRVPLWVKATAGVRRQSRPDQERIVTAAAQCLGAARDFELKNAEVIPGSREGVYAWLAVNDLAGTLRTDRIEETKGIVDLGGQSAQIAYRIPRPPSTVPPQRGTIASVPFGPDMLHIFAVSEELGRDAASAQIRRSGPDPCRPSGIPSECVRSINAFVCPSAGPDVAGESCPERLPEVTASAAMAFVGLSNFAYVGQNTGLGSGVKLERVREWAEQFCGPSTERFRDRELVRGYLLQPAEPYRDDVCFDALYTTQLASFVWGLSLGRIESLDLRRSGEVSWPVGAMIVEAATEARRLRGLP